MISDDRSDGPLNRFDEIADYRSKKRLLRYQVLVTTGHGEREARANLLQRRIRAARSFRVARRVLARILLLLLLLLL